MDVATDLDEDVLVKRVVGLEVITDRVKTRVNVEESGVSMAAVISVEAYRRAPTDAA